MDCAQLEFCRTLAGEALAASDLPDDPLAAAAALRRVCSAAQASAVLELRAMRSRAARDGRLPAALAGRLLGDKTMLAQASSIRLACYVGAHLAGAVRAVGAPCVMDLCCGMGIDAIGAALAGARVAGYDVSASAILCAAHNAQSAGVGDRCAFHVQDVTSLALDEPAVVHVDPDRRRDGRRHVVPACYAPPEEFLRGLLARAAVGAVKLSPAVDRRSLETWRAARDIRLEYVSESGVCRQLVVWWGAGPSAACQATVVGGDWAALKSATLPGGQAPAAHVSDSPGAYILEPDPAVIAAGAVDDLSQRLNEPARRVWRLGERLDWLTSDAPATGPLLRCFRVLAEVPGRTRDVAAAVRDLDGGPVEVKPRGVRLDTDALQRELAGAGQRRLAVLWGRFGQVQRAYITERTDLSE